MEKRFGSCQLLKLILPKLDQIFDSLVRAKSKTYLIVDLGLSDFIEFLVLVAYAFSRPNIADENRE